jgi:hypothetical protein
MPQESVMPSLWERVSGHTNEGKARRSSKARKKYGTARSSGAVKGERV